MTKSPMSATDILFDPIIKPKPVAASPDTGVSRGAEWLTVEILTAGPRSTYMLAAGEVMDQVVARHAIPEFIDVRTEANTPRGALHLTGVVSRFYDGQEEVWVSCPSHMPPDRMRFRGRFGFKKICQLPLNHGSMDNVLWSWIETNAGHIPALDLGLVMAPTTDRWYRVFGNKNEASSYYQS